MLKFSVIIPAYNREPLIGTTLDSIFNQTLPPAEVIVVDDGSTDRTAEIVSTWPKCTLIRSENAGAAAARHKGVLASSGDWLAFCDSDDLWRPDHLASLAAASRHVQEKGMVFSNFMRGDGQVWETATKFDTAPTDFWSKFKKIDATLSVAETPIFQEVLRFQPIFQSCTAMSRPFYTKVGGYNGAFGRLPSEDLEFTLRCVRHAPIAATWEPTALIRRHAGNHSRDQMRQLTGEVAILLHARASMELAVSWREELDHQIIVRSAEAIDAAFTQKRWETLTAMAKHVPWRHRSAKQIVKVLLSQVAGAFPGRDQRELG
ncbi:glycosyltransferase family 2 protein [Rhodospirillum rubrum]|uniref:Glycosyl transferase, family 2 n=1 Tax=Rhodospirillum rubrum (strain ATCC 11170 / ATH 1.1.1 / DSM 467 / LMG 4362 / NCIMB 8255 / S1) TaxID=269796 RepID=Q2RVV6_RHORT|nr:glycosyltransferase family 2 protein [Rhodospirillum rubrum]ABC21739.1 Glycosyl transferase, family 2 [Rhodospirillum rubrum ATCC 11170]AEO47437.1 glycosyl transferase family protein [Rhodospirillum rubrum F11]MBK5953295.1 glycosyl transferase [Rhodospirillum rubrum]QXG81401.1 glycosyltransferase [Rhodospirillum rubrum]HCF17592.1 glycosyl transferase [Rhodospirillum rubrum]